MHSQSGSTPVEVEQPIAEYDAIVVGAGPSGLLQLHHLLRLGLSVRCVEIGSGVGGSWYWNRYPGCRFDSESDSYGYAFSEELLQEWDWKEAFSSQPENERYYNYVADKFDLRRHIEFNTRVIAATYDKSSNRWTIETEGGSRARAQFLALSVGSLSASYVPPFQGLDSFKGEFYFAPRWPHHEVKFEGKRVAVIGTGSTGIQLIESIGKKVDHLTVFQRTANYALPLRNTVRTKEELEHIKTTYPEIFERCHQANGGYVHMPIARKAMDVPKEERWAKYEELWARPGFAKWQGNFFDLMRDPAANADFSDFLRTKLRGQIKDPAKAKLLIPTDHPFGSKRPPMETSYFEVMNQDNVELIDIKATPIETITPKGIKTSAAEYEFDMIILATGFDAVSGSLNGIDIRGVDGVSHKEVWKDGPRNYLNVAAAGFPNMFYSFSMMLANYIICAEVVVNWVTSCIKFMRENNYSRISPTRQAEHFWVEHCKSLAAQTVIGKSDSHWLMGLNIPGKANVPWMTPETVPNYIARLKRVEDDGYEGFVLER